MTLTDSYEGDSKNFNVNITLNGTTPDISADTVTIYFKKIDEATIRITKEADVTTSGAEGTAIFELDTSDTNVPSGQYEYWCVWVTSGGQRRTTNHSNVNILESVP
jgi:flagellar hook assembly protein FlgD